VEKTKECRGGEQRAENERVREVTGVRATHFTNWGQVENAGKSRHGMGWDDGIKRDIL